MERKPVANHFPIAFSTAFIIFSSFSSESTYPLPFLKEEEERKEKEKKKDETLLQTTQVLKGLKMRS